MELNQIISIAIFAVLFFAALGYHGYAIKNYWQMIKKAQPLQVDTPLFDRVKSVIVNVLLQKKLLKHPVRGVFHIFIFYGFLVYGLHTSSQFIGGFMGDYEFYIPALLGEEIHYIYDFILDIFSLLVLAGLLYFAMRRWVFRAPELDRPSGQSAIVIFLISSLMITSLIGEGARQALNPVDDLPIRQFIAQFFTENLVLSNDNLQLLFKIGWWGHIITVFTFMVFLPTSKHAHLIWAPVNFFFQPNSPKGAINFLDTENAPVWGAANVHDFNWLNLLDGLSCIECGRCTIQCPANRTGKVLNPKEIMVDLKHAVMDQMPISVKALAEGKSADEMATLEGTRVIDTHTSQEALWACTTCYACVEACPVGNNHVDAIVSMRRSLVLNEGALPVELQNALVNVENQSNPWGVGSHKREEWAEGLDIKTMAQLKENGEEADVLFWVGCAGAFDDRNKKIAQSFASVLKKGDVKFGILGNEEQCTGDSARRAGNEYLFQTLAQANIETLNGYNAKKIVTACPHCFNTLQNEYPQLGGNYEVIHHSTFLNNLVKDKKINIDSAKIAEIGEATYHDSCYLGRYNDNYAAPRDVLATATGKPVREPSDHHSTALCCGAGGAQMWKEEEKGSSRVNETRTAQLMNTNAGTIATACPFCITMVEDGVKAAEKLDEYNVLDIAEVIDKASEKVSV